jgi:hypothetical protein
MTKEEIRRKRAQAVARIRFSARALIVVGAVAAVGAWAAVLIGNTP